ncbi:MAG: hypothetical protein AAF433_00165 [Bacteroidota bacterium]
MSDFSHFGFPANSLAIEYRARHHAASIGKPKDRGVLPSKILGMKLCVAQLQPLAFDVGLSHSKDEKGRYIFCLEVEEFMRAGVQFAHRFIHDYTVRLAYIQELLKLSADYLSKVKLGLLSPFNAAALVSKERGVILDKTRKVSSDFAKAYAKWRKAENPSLHSLCEKYAGRKFEKTFSSLTKNQKDEVFKAIIEAAGRDSIRDTTLARNLSKAGKVLLVLGLAVAVYNVTTAENKLKAVGKEATIFAGGAAGATAGGAAGAFCGPGAIVCVPIGIFLGGMLGANGAEKLFDRIFK